MRDFLFGCVTGSGLLWAVMSHRRDVYWRELNSRRQGGNPPPPGRMFNRGGICPNPDTSLMLRKPAPPAGPPNYDWRRRFNHENTNPPTGAPPLKLRQKKAQPDRPPEQPLTAQMIRYWAWQNEQVRRAWSDPGLGEPWPEDCTPDRQDVPIRLDEGRVQRGDFGDGPTTPKPPIKPQPHGGRLIKSWEEPSPPSEL